MRKGELSYFKEDDLENALSIIELSAANVQISKKGIDGFIIHTNKKQFHFRIPVPASDCMFQRSS